MIDERLKTIADMVSKPGTLLDVGTDHGYLPIYLVQNKVVKNIIASDVSKGSLSKAIIQVKLHKLESSIETRLGSGLEVIKEGDKIDTIVISGMGGNLISELIDKRLKHIRKNDIEIIVQPVQLPESIRKYFYENNFDILEEKLAKADGRIYHIIKAKARKVNLPIRNFSEGDVTLELGECIMSDKSFDNLMLLKELVYYKLKKQYKIKEKLEITDSNNIKDRYKVVLKKIESLNNVLEKID